MEIVWPLEQLTYIDTSTPSVDIYIGGPQEYSAKFTCNFDMSVVFTWCSNYEIQFCRGACRMRVLGGGARRAAGWFKCEMQRADYIIWKSIDGLYGRFDTIVPTFARAVDCGEKIRMAVSALPQPIAEEIIPHLVMSVRTILSRGVY